MPTQSPNTTTSSMETPPGTPRTPIPPEIPRTPENQTQRGGGKPPSSHRKTNGLDQNDSPVNDDTDETTC